MAMWLKPMNDEEGINAVETKAISLLRRTQWSATELDYGDDDDHWSSPCPVCRGLKEYGGYKEDCELAKLIQ